LPSLRPGGRRKDTDSVLLSTAKDPGGSLRMAE
jgi:hypothetical protein